MNGKVLAGLIILAACSLSVSLPAQGQTSADALEKRVELAFIATPLQDVIDYLENVAFVEIELDSGLDNQQPITSRVKNVTLKSALQGVLEPLGLTFTARPDRIVIIRDKSKIPPLEYGHGLRPEETSEGWIALYDGKTTFGWKNARTIGRQIVRMEGGETTSSFGDYLLRADISVGGRMTVGNKTIEVERGRIRREATGTGPIVLHDKTAVTMLAIQPLGLRPLFNGKELGEWQRIDRQNLPAEKRPQWRVENGAIRATGGPGALEHPNRYGNFILQVDVKTLAESANGGVFFRSRPGDFMNGYEAQIYNRMIDNDPAQPFRWSTGSIDDRQLARRVVSRDGIPFRMTIVANRPHIATWVNGYQLVDWTDTRSPHDNPRQGLRIEPGTLQLQAHDPETDVEFREIKIAELK